MEHLFHFFGGGCGEHMLWPWLVAFGSSSVVWLRTVGRKGEKEQDKQRGE